MTTDERTIQIDFTCLAPNFEYAVETPMQSVARLTILLEEILSESTHVDRYSACREKIKQAARHADRLGEIDLRENLRGTYQQFPRTGEVNLVNFHNQCHVLRDMWVEDILRGNPSPYTPFRG